MVTKSLFISDFITKTLVVGHLRLPVNVMIKKTIDPFMVIFQVSIKIHF